jgi:S-adenosylmethionine hydrolase
MKLITFLTDFGTNSGYVSQMKGVALSITDAKLVDITHEVTPQNVKEGAFILRSSIPFFPAGSVHVAVVDPGVGTERRGIVITAPSQILVGPDNGLLIPAARYLGNFTVYEIKNPKLLSDSISNTFHGRDIFTPVAAHILNGVLFEHIGPIIKDFVDLDFGNYEMTNNSANGKIIYIDKFGNIITNISGDRLSKVLNYNKEVTLSIFSKNLIVKFVKAYNFVKEGEILLTIGSSNLLEIALNQGNAAKKLSVKVDDEVRIQFN